MNLNMLNKRSLLFILIKASFGIVLILLFLNCGSYSKNNYLNDFGIFVNETKDNSAKYSEKDWTDADQQYNEFAVVQYEKFLPELSIEDKITIGKLKTIYTALKVKKGANGLFDSAKEIFNKAESLIDSSMKKINKQ